MKKHSSRVRFYPACLGKALPFFTGLLALPLAPAWGQAIQKNPGFNIQTFQVNGGVNGLDNTLEAMAVWDVVGGTNTTGPVVGSNGQNYDVTVNNTGVVSTINFGGDAGNFNGDIPYNSIPGYTFNGGDQYSSRANAFLAIPVGDWSIAIASDDGRRIQFSGGSFPGFTFNGAGEQVQFGGAGQNFVGRNDGTAHDQTVGTFTIAAGNTFGTTGLALLDFSGFMYEGNGGDSFEIFIKNGLDTTVPGDNNSDPQAANEGWQLLSDNVLGWSVSRTAITFLNPPTNSVTWDGTVNGNWNAGAAVWENGVPPAAPDNNDGSTPISTTAAYVPSGTALVTDAQSAQTLDIAATTNGGPTGGTVQVNSNGVLAIVSTIAIGPTGTLGIDGTGTVSAASIATDPAGRVTLSNGGTLTSVSGGTLGTLTLNSAGTLAGGMAYTASATTINNAVLTLAANTQATLNNVSGAAGTDNLTVAGSGTVILPTANTYTGTTTINGGVVRMGNSESLGDETGATVINGGTLDIAGNRAGANRNELIQVQGTGFNGQGAITNSGAGGFDNFRRITLTGDATFRTDNRYDIRSNGQGATFDMGGFTLTKVGGSEFSLVDTVITNPGSVNVTQGLFRVEGSTDFDGAGTVNVNGGTTLDFYASNQTHNVNVTLQGGSNLATNGGGSPTLAGTVNLAGGQANVNINGPMTIAGPVTGGGGINKTGGGGRLTLTNAASTFTGPVVITSGTVEATSTGAVGNSSGYTVGGGTTLELSGTGAAFTAPVTAPLTLNGAGEGGGGALRSSGVSKTVSGPVTLPASATVTNATAGTTLTVSGPVTLGVTSNLTLDGPGNTVIGMAFGNGAGPIVDNAIQETYFDSQNDGQNGNPNIDPRTNIEGFRALPVGANDYRGLLTTRFDLPDDNAFNTRAANGGVPTFDPGGQPGGENFSALFLTTFTPDESGAWQFRSSLIDDTASFWIDTTGTAGVFDSLIDRFIDFPSFTNGGTTGSTPTLTAGTSYLMGIVLRDTGGGGALADVDFQRPSGAGGFIDLNPSANPGLFTVAQNPLNALVKNGAGITTLMGANTYNGGTTVNAGTLLVNNAVGSGTGSGNVTINGGGFLGGNGTVGIASTVSSINSGATLSPGGDAGQPLFGVGTLTFGGDLVLTPGSTAVLQLNNSTLMLASLADLATLTDPANNLGDYDRILVGDALSLAAGSNVNLDLTNYNPRTGDVFDLFDFAGGSLGSLPNFAITGGSLGSFILDTSRFLDLGVIAIVPEPSRALLLLGSLCLLAARRRRR